MPNHSLASTALALTLAAGPVSQSYAGPNDRRDLAEEIELSVGQNFTLPIKDGESIDQAAESGRTAAYARTGKECTILLATIASSCRLLRVNINSNSFQPPAGPQTVQINANATYKIVPK